MGLGFEPQRNHFFKVVIDSLLQNKTQNTFKLLSFKILAY
nr:MAG TPA: hypothetical protein [Caudoviricetes sp.]